MKGVVPPSANLDFLRAVAVLLVVSQHFMQMFGREVTFGHFGVLIFFVHTCLVLLMSLERLQRSGSGVIVPFYIRRFFRIYPLSVACVLILVVARIPYDRHLGAVYEPFRWPGWGTVFSNLSLTQNITRVQDLSAPLWSLPYEVQMYLVLPFVFMLLWRWQSMWLATGLWVLGSFLGEVEALISGGGSTLLYYLGCFSGGIVAYVGLARFRRRFPAAGWPLAIAVLLAYAIFVSHTGRDQVFCLLLGSSIPLFAELRAHWVCTAAHAVAKYSYGIYLSHFPVMWFCFSKLGGEPLWLRLTAFVLLGSAIPILAYHLLEHPAIQFGIRLTRRVGKDLPAKAAVATAS